MKIKLGTVKRLIREAVEDEFNNQEVTDDNLTAWGEAIASRLQSINGVEWEGDLTSQLETPEYEPHFLSLSGNVSFQNKMYSMLIHLMTQNEEIGGDSNVAMLEFELSQAPAHHKNIWKKERKEITSQTSPDEVARQVEVWFKTHLKDLSQKN